MHEYSIATDIAAIVKRTADGRPVKKITLTIGALSGVFSESLLMYLELVLPEAGMEGVSVETKEIPATFSCCCGEQYAASSVTTPCPRCGGYVRSVQTGQDCTVESIEVEDD